MPLRRGRGLSLIELMVALAIASFLMLGLVQMFSATRTAYQLSEGLARAQESGRFAMDYLQRDLRMAGHFGCVNDEARFLSEGEGLNSLFLNAAQRAAGEFAVAADPLRFDISIQGYEFDDTGSASEPYALESDPEPATDASLWTPALPDAVLDTTVLPGSDVVVIRYFAPEGIPVTGFAQTEDETTISVDPTRINELTVGAPDGGLFGISDCLRVSVFQASSVFDAGGSMQVTTDAGLNKSNFTGGETYVTGQATLHRAETVAYYVGEGTGGEPSLFRRRFVSRVGVSGIDEAAWEDPEELVQGVELMQFRYGSDDQTDLTQPPTGFISGSAEANGVADDIDDADFNNIWRRVGLVQIGLLVRSPQRAGVEQREAGESTSGLSMLGLQVTPPNPNDGFYRTVYESSVAVRNRLFGN